MVSSGGLQAILQDIDRRKGVLVEAGGRAADSLANALIDELGQRVPDQSKHILATGNLFDAITTKGPLERRGDVWWIGVGDLSRLGSPGEAAPQNTIADFLKARKQAREAVKKGPPPEALQRIAEERKAAEFERIEKMWREVERIDSKSLPALEEAIEKSRDLLQKNIDELNRLREIQSRIGRKEYGKYAEARYASRARMRQLREEKIQSLSNLIERRRRRIATLSRRIGNLSRRSNELIEAALRLAAQGGHKIPKGWFE